MQYLGMKRNNELYAGGVLDNQEGLIKDFKFLSLNECRATLCIHMLCYVLTGGIRINELLFWKKMVERVEYLYQADRSKYTSTHFLFYETASMSTTDLRAYMLKHVPAFKRLLDRIPIAGGKRSVFRASKHSTCARAPVLTARSRVRNAVNEKKELTELMLKPAHAAVFSELIPFYVCQRFRNMVPLSADMLAACFDPEQSMVRRTIPRHEQSVNAIACCMHLSDA